MKAYRYFILSLAIVLTDQVTKWLVVKFIPPYTVAWNAFGDFFRLIHVRNHGVAFSMGDGFPDFLRVLLFIVVPLIILGAVAFYIVRGRDLTGAQKWVLAAIIGGGLGNQIDRIFRSDGVVDFLDVKFYGLFGMERWPTFNVADSSLVVSALILVVMLIVQDLRAKKS